ncbi:MAG: threonine/serine dehydratase [Nevskiaceae bacterium]
MLSVEDSVRTPPTFAEVAAAADRLQGRVVRTPVWRSVRLDARTGRRVYLKCENLQHVGAFKYRGALNALLHRQAAATAPGLVATHSSGNHGAALARAARELGWECCVVVPRDTSAAKLANIRAQGVEPLLCEPGLAAREATTAKLIAERGAELVHPFDDARVIAGQGTAALELFAEVPHLDVLSAPVGGGGLLAGSALAARAMNRECRVIGVEPELADDAARSFHSGARVGFATPPPTLADGLRGSIGALPFELFRRHVDEVLTVSEAAIVTEMRGMLDECSLLIEASSAVPVAARRESRLGSRGDAVGIILSGGNVDLGVCPFLAGRATS